MTTTPIIQPYPPQDGKEYECQCARCGSSADYVHCEYCSGLGLDGHDCGDDCCVCLHPEENVPCDICRGRGGWYLCLSSPEWCKANPLPGRENVPREAIEWFLVKERNDATHLHNVRTHGT